MLSINFYSAYNDILRVVFSLLTAFFITLLIGYIVIIYLRKISFNQKIRKFNNKPISSIDKESTPTSGGIVIIISIIISTLIWIHPINDTTICIIMTLISYGILGFIDDYIKIINRNTNGIRALQKYFWQSIIAIIDIIIIYRKDIIHNWSEFFFCKENLFYILLAYFCILGTSNAVNITDGLDGLAILPISLVATGFVIVSLLSSNSNLSDYLHIFYTKSYIELAVICAIIIGSSLGFLWFNTYPAKIFMGDTGSLSLGGVLGVISVFLHQELFLIFIGGIFVIETLSVIFQVISFRLFGRRIFLISPIHHHYEIKGCHESCLVVRFWIISLIFLIIGLLTLKLYHGFLYR